MNVTNLLFRKKYHIVELSSIGPALAGQAQILARGRSRSSPPPLTLTTDSAYAQSHTHTMLYLLSDDEKRIFYCHRLLRRNSTRHRLSQRNGQGKQVRVRALDTCKPPSTMSQ